MIYRVIGREKITDLNTAAVGFGAAYIPPAENNTMYAMVQVQGKDCRWRVDGGTPDANTGMYLAENGIIEVWGADDLINFLCIEDNGTAQLEIIYYGRGG